MLSFIILIGNIQGNQMGSLLNAKKAGARLTLNQLASPLIVNLEHIHRVTLFLNKKQCGTTMPLVLYSALKVRYMSELGIVKEDSSMVEKGLNEALRRLLTDIHLLAEELNTETKKISIANSLQEIVFRHVVWDDVLQATADNVVDKSRKNKAHTITFNQDSSVTVHAYLCRWVLEKNGLNKDMDYKHTNPYIREVIESLLPRIAGESETRLKTGGSFSRRVQNAIMMLAFSDTMTSDENEILILNPAIAR
jgi:hypothetical protein